MGGEVGSVSILNMRKCWKRSPLPALPRRPGEGKTQQPSSTPSPGCRGMVGVGAVLVLLFACNAHADLIDYFATPDQQGRWYFERGDYETAAASFADPTWKGLSFYRAGDYGNALAEFSRLDTADGYFLQGNAQAHLKKYEAAVKSYDNALQARADFPQAKANRALVAALIPKPDDESDEEPPDLPPDEVKFDDKGKKGKEKTMSPEMVRKLTADLWMKNLQVSPGEFLRQKFQIEAEEK
jgi:Ca-activated chloride channel family protein